MAIAPLPDLEHLDALTATRPPLRLLSFPGESGRAADQVVAPSWRETAGSRSRRRRLALLVLALGLLVGLALPLRAVAGTSASALVPGATYVVAPGDTLASIAHRLGPASEESALVSQMARETGSRSVVVGEHIVLP